MDKEQLPQHNNGLTERQRFWLKHISACIASGKRFRRYVADHELNYSTFEKMRLKLIKIGALSADSKSAEQPIFQKVTTDYFQPHGFHNIRLVLPNGIGIEFSGEHNADALEEVLRIAGRIQ